MTLDDLINVHGPHQRPKYGESPNIHVWPSPPEPVDPNAIEMDNMGFLEKLLYLMLGYHDV